MTESEQRRFLTKFRVGDGCWEWTASVRRDGYGQFRLDGRVVSAHRVSYGLFVGPIPEGLTLDHLCRNRLCVRPDHLEPVTLCENILRGESLPAQNARKTQCPQGHAYDEANTRIGRHGWRVCRTCHRDRERERRGLDRDAGMV